MEEVASSVMSEALLESSSVILRSSRLIRCTRVLRMVRVMRLSPELQLLISCIMKSARAFFWSMALLLVMTYGASASYTNIVLVERLQGSTAPGEIDDMMEYYSSVPRSLLSLLQAISGGVDWNDICAPLFDWHWMLGVSLVAYVLFAIFAVMNVVTSTFVNTALEQSEHVRYSRKIDHALSLFKSIDRDNSSTITADEINDHMDDPLVQQFLKSLDVGVDQARFLFEMLDTDGGGSIDLQEFLSGCIRLQMPPKFLDLLLWSREGKHSRDEIGEQLERLGEAIGAQTRPGLQRRRASCNLSGDNLPGAVDDIM